MKNNKRKLSTLTVCLLLTVLLTVGGVIAYIFTLSDAVTNTFNPVLPKIEIPEEMKDYVKENATVQNTGEVDSYLRAKIVVTWQNAAEEVYPATPQLGTDYTMKIGDNWVKVGDFYYYNKIAKPGQPAVEKVDGEIVYGEGVTAADMLIVKAEVKAKAPAEGYKLHIEILGQGIQSEGVNSTTGETPIQEAWKIDPATFIGKTGGN